MSGRKDTLEYFSLIASVLVGISGMASILAAAIILFSSSHDVPWSHFVLWGLLFLAIASVFTAVLGCASAISDNRSIQLMYIIALLAIILPQLILSTLAVTRDGQIENTLDRAWQYLYENHSPKLANFEERYNCCGFHNILDRPVLTPYSDTCIVAGKLGATAAAATEGCLRALSDAWYHDHSPVLGGLGFFAVLVQLVAAAIAIGLRRRVTIDQEEEEVDGEDITGEERRLLPGARVFGNPNAHPAEPVAVE